MSSLFGGPKFPGRGGSRGYQADISNYSFFLLKVTTWLFLTCSAISASHKFFGPPMLCDIDSSSVSKELYTSYCFTEGTFKLQDGVGHGLGRADSRNIHQEYYIWANLSMVLMAGWSYVPWFVWKCVEGRKVSKLLTRVSQDILTETPVESQVLSISTFLLSHPGWYNCCALKLLLCQAGSVFVALTQIALMGTFLGHRFPPPLPFTPLLSLDGNKTDRINQLKS